MPLPAPLEALKARGVSYSVVPVTPGDNDATVDAFRKALGPKTKLAVCTMASNVFGIRVPVERITALCHQYGVKVCVDTAQGAGLFPIHMEESGIDFLCCAGHKGLYGPMGHGAAPAAGAGRAFGNAGWKGGTGDPVPQPSSSRKRPQSATKAAP